MPVNKNALIRYRTIDKCLSNRRRKWTMQDLIDACSKAVFGENTKKQVSRRTIQLDMQTMRNGQLGYDAPIIVVEKKHYTYEDSDFSITNIPISENELDKLNEVVVLLKQFAGFSRFAEIDGMVKKLEDKIEVVRNDRSAIIHLDQNTQLKGLEYLDELYQHILNENVLKIKYQAFHRHQKSNIVVHPYFLKEYNNRWYLIGFSEQRRKIITLALDRMSGMEITKSVSFFENNFFKPDIYFKEVIGMTVDLKSKPVEILLYIDAQMAPYILTKPLHHSQKLIWEKEKAVVISLTVRVNFELKEKIRSLGKHIMVLRPTKLKNWFENDLLEHQKLYDNKALRISIWKDLKRKRKQST